MPPDGVTCAIPFAEVDMREEFRVNDTLVDRELVGLLELREEVLVVEKRREQVASREVRRERRVREETVRVKLVAEVLVITAKEGSPSEPFELAYEEVAVTRTPATGGTEDDLHQ